MMKKFFLLITVMTSSAFADEYRHIVTFGTTGLGWSGAAERMDTESGSPFRRVDHILQNLGFNYGYRIQKRWIVGLFVDTAHSEYKFVKRDGNKGQVEYTGLTGGLYVLYNFSDTISNTWYTGLSAASFYYREEIAHDVAIAESKTPFELDDAGEVYEWILGRRFSLKKWNIDHLTYAPQIGIFARTHSKDFKDQKVGDGIGLSFQPVKFDVLF